MPKGRARWLKKVPTEQEKEKAEKKRPQLGTCV